MKTKALFLGEKTTQVGSGEKGERLVFVTSLLTPVMSLMFRITHPIPKLPWRQGLWLSRWTNIGTTFLGK